MIQNLIYFYFTKIENFEKTKQFVSKNLKLTYQSFEHIERCLLTGQQQTMLQLANSSSYIPKIFKDAPRNFQPAKTRQHHRGKKTPLTKNYTHNNHAPNLLSDLLHKEQHIYNSNIAT